MKGKKEILDREAESSKKVEYTEGVHFYIEKGLFVMTEKFHIERGYCCQSGCRHCPYGFKKEDKP